MAKKNRINLSYVGENIKKIRQAKKLSQADFSKIFSLARASIGAYEEGRSEPKIETLIQIANHFSISVDALLTRKLTVAEIFRFNSLNEKLDQVHQLKGKTSLTTPTVKLVRASEYLNYVTQHGDKNYLRDLEDVGLPLISRKPDLAFEMNGSEMMTSDKGLRHGDILFGKELDKGELESKTGKVVAIVSPTELTIKRLKQLSENAIILSSDDSNYQEKRVDLSDINRCFEIISVYSEYIPAYTTEDRLSKIEEQLKNLNK